MYGRGEIERELRERKREELKAEEKKPAVISQIQQSPLQWQSNR